MNKQLLNKYFRNQCSLKEVEQVLAWFQTEEGAAYLEKSLEQDILHFADEERLMLYPDIASEKLLGRIYQSKKRMRNKFGYRSYWAIRAVVAVLVIGFAASFTGYFLYEKYQATSQPPEIVYRTITTQSGQHRLVTLSDGTKIRLNSNSSIRVPDPLPANSRQITLRGEAWFDIAPDVNRPFLLAAGGTEISVLGTEFNVKIDSLAQQVQVAVAEGRVSFNKENGAGQSAILAKNTFALYDLKNEEILIEQTPVDNYLSWFNGRLYFYNDPLRTVSRYLERIYNVSIRFEEDSLKELPLSIDLAREDLHHVLDIIGKTLSISYTLENDAVLWKHQQPTETNQQPQ